MLINIFLNNADPRFLAFYQAHLRDG